MSPETFLRYPFKVTCGLFFGPQMALAYQLDDISQGPKKSRFPGPNSIPLPLENDEKDAARIKSITHGAI